MCLSLVEGFISITENIQRVYMYHAVSEMSPNPKSGRKLTNTNVGTVISNTFEMFSTEKISRIAKIAITEVITFRRIVQF